MAFIAIDIGNSSIKVGLFINPPEPVVIRHDTLPAKSPEHYEDFIREGFGKTHLEKICDRVIISSVVPGHTGLLLKAAGMLGLNGPLLAGAKISGGLTIDVEAPEQVGSDRIAAATAAFSLMGAPVAVVDIGTATTVDFVAQGGVFIGGAIFPGMALMADSLCRQTAALPQVDISKPEHPVGRNTAEAITAGIVMGTAGAIEKIIAEAEKAKGISCQVVLTGGYAKLIQPFLGRPCSLEPDLTLKGLSFIYLRETSPT